LGAAAAEFKGSADAVCWKAICKALMGAAAARPSADTCSATGTKSKGCMEDCMKGGNMDCDGTATGGAWLLAVISAT
jgi:hypothetical protein